MWVRFQSRVPTGRRSGLNGVRAARIAAAWLFCATAGPIISRAAVVGQFDVNGFTTAAGPTQTGYTALNYKDSTSATASATSANLGTGLTPTLTLISSNAGTLLARDRTGETSTFAALYEDFATDSQTGAAGNLTISVTNLAPSTLYDIRFQAHDNTLTDTYRFTETTGGDPAGSKPTGTIVNTASPLTSVSTDSNGFPTSDSLNLRVLTDGSGTVSFSEIETTTANNHQPRLNGLEIATTPEPSALGLLAAAGFFLCHRRRPASR